MKGDRGSVTEFGLLYHQRQAPFQLAVDLIKAGTDLGHLLHDGAAVLSASLGAGV